MQYRYLTIILLYNQILDLTLNTHPANSGQIISLLSTLRIIKPNDTSATFDVKRYGTFTANFTPIPPAIPPAFLLLIVGFIFSSLIGWSIPSIMGRVKAKRQQ